MKIALAQMKMSESIIDNFAKSLALIQSAAKAGAKLICFPEIQLSPFFPQYENQDASAWIIPSESSFIDEIRNACKSAGIFASPNFYVEESGKRYDMSLLISDTGGSRQAEDGSHCSGCLLL